MLTPKLPPATMVSSQWSFQTASQAPAGMLQVKDQGFRVHGGVPRRSLDTEASAFFCKKVCTKPTCLLNNAEILLWPENLVRGFGWCRGFLVLLLYIKVNFTIKRLSVSKFGKVALCINGVSHKRDLK